MPEPFFSQTIKEIREIIEREEFYLNSLDEEFIISKLNSQKRSIKQIVGHLIDSASNNLHRIVHLHYNEIPLVFPNYATNGNNDRWIAIQNYQEEDWYILIQLWKYSNLHIIHVMEQVDVDKINNKWIASQGKEVSLKDMILDYPRHLKLHIREIHDLYES
jgi:hypothetical protein